MSQFLTLKNGRKARRPVVLRRAAAVVLAVAGVLPLFARVGGDFDPVGILIRLTLALGGLCLALVFWRRPDVARVVRDPVPVTSEEPAADGHLPLWLAGAGVLALIAAAVWTRFHALSL